MFTEDKYFVMDAMMSAHHLGRLAGGQPAVGPTENSRLPEKHFIVSMTNPVNFFSFEILKFSNYLNFFSSVNSVDGITAKKCKSHQIT